MNGWGRPGNHGDLASKNGFQDSKIWTEQSESGCSKSHGDIMGIWTDTIIYDIINQSKSISHFTYL